MKNYYWILGLWIPLGSMAQTPNENSSLEYQIESLVDEENESQLLQVAEALEKLKTEKIKVNFATAENLAQLPFLNIFQIHNLLEYRRQTGPIYTHYELQNIKGFDRELIETLLPYLSFSVDDGPPKLDRRKVLEFGQHQILYRHQYQLQKRLGYKRKQNSYLGSPHKLFSKYQFGYKNMLGMAISLEQDAGEPFSQKGIIDHVSGNIHLKNYGFLKSLVLGDYQIEFGQGLALWSGPAFGKSAEVINIKKYARGIQAFSGVEENRFFRGIASQVQFNNWELLGFYSNKKLDARLVDDKSISSFLSSGLHRTSSEIAHKNSVQMQAIGSRLKYVGNPYSISLHGTSYFLNKTLIANNRLDRKHHFHGKKLSNYSISANYHFRSFNFFGEFAISNNLSNASLVGFQSILSDGFYLSILHRSLSPSYQFIHNGPFAERGTNGESGTYLGVDWTVNKLLNWKFYIDVYQFRWPVFNSHLPSKGLDFLSQWNLQFSRLFDAYLRIKHETKELEIKQESILPKLNNESRLNIRFHVNYQPASQIKLSNRIELVHIIPSHEKGLILYQNLQWVHPRWPLKIKTRYALFESSSFQSRIYVYENDLSYTFSIPSFSGAGNRFYFLVDWDMMKKLKIQLKYGVTSYSDREEIGSGLDKVDGNRLGELKVQVRYKF